MSSRCCQSTEISCFYLCVAIVFLCTGHSNRYLHGCITFKPLQLGLIDIVDGVCETCPQASGTQAIMMNDAGASCIALYGVVQ